MTEDEMWAMSGTYGHGALPGRGLDIAAIFERRSMCRNRESLPPWWSGLV